MTNAITMNLKCPPVPKDVALRYCWTKPSDKLEERYQPAADWGFAHGLAAAERLAAEEWQKGADEELEACVQWLKKALCEELCDLLDQIDLSIFRRAGIFREVQTRARAALEAAPAPVPVPVAERLPAPEDCDAEGRCWWWMQLGDGRRAWLLRPQLLVPALASIAVPRRTHWLPAHALPLPAGEVKP